MEERAECSGLCKPANFYSFSNVQNGPPKQACLGPIVEDFSGSTGNYRKYATTLIAPALVVLLGWYLSFGVCFRLKWEHRGSPLTLGYVIKRVDTDV